MAKYEVEVNKTLIWLVEVEAETLAEAKAQAMAAAQQNYEAGYAVADGTIYEGSNDYEAHAREVVYG